MLALAERRMKSSEKLANFWSISARVSIESMGSATLANSPRLPLVMAERLTCFKAAMRSGRSTRLGTMRGLRA
ncbi:hypothetical protein D3C85_1848280 [compost metagenome]